MEHDYKRFRERHGLAPAKTALYSGPRKSVVSGLNVVVIELLHCNSSIG